jgi:hypothetical protein
MFGGNPSILPRLCISEHTAGIVDMALLTTLLCVAPLTLQALAAASLSKLGSDITLLYQNDLDCESIPSPDSP